MQTLPVSKPGSIREVDAKTAQYRQRLVLDATPSRATSSSAVRASQLNIQTIEVTLTMLLILMSTWALVRRSAVKQHASFIRNSLSQSPISGQSDHISAEAAISTIRSGRKQMSARGLAIGVLLSCLLSWQQFRKFSLLQKYEADQRKAVSMLVVDKAEIYEPHSLHVALYNPTSTEIDSDVVYHVVLRDLSVGLPKIIQVGNIVLMPDGSTMQFPDKLSSTRIASILMSNSQFASFRSPIVQFDRRFRQRLHVSAMQPTTEYVDIGLPFDIALDVQTTVAVP